MARVIAAEEQQNDFGKGFVAVDAARAAAAKAGNTVNEAANTVNFSDPNRYVAVDAARSRNAGVQMPQVQAPTMQMPDLSTRAGIVSRIADISTYDPKQAETLYNQLDMLTVTPGNPLYYQYATSTNVAIKQLRELGVDVPDNVTSEWILNNQHLKDGAKLTLAGNLSSSNTAKTPVEQKVAYLFNELEKEVGPTEQAKGEFAGLLGDIAYWAGRTDRNYTDEEIASKIDWKKYPTLAKMDDPNTHLSFNEAIGYNKDDIGLYIWQARNGGGSGNADADRVRQYRGEGNVYTANSAVRNLLDPTSPDYNPYKAGGTADDVLAQLGVQSYGREMFSDPAFLQLMYTNPKLYEQAYEIEETTETAEKEIDAINSEWNSYFFTKDGKPKKNVESEEKCRERIETYMKKNCPTLLKMEKSLDRNFPSNNFVHTSHGLNWGGLASLEVPKKEDPVKQAEEDAKKVDDRLEVTHDVLRYVSNPIGALVTTGKYAYKWLKPLFGGENETNTNGDTAEKNGNNKAIGSTTGLAFTDKDRDEAQIKSANLADASDTIYEVGTEDEIAALEDFRVGPVTSDALAQTITANDMIKAFVSDDTRKMMQDNSRKYMRDNLDAMYGQPYFDNMSVAAVYLDPESVTNSVRIYNEQKALYESRYGENIPQEAQEQLASMKAAILYMDQIDTFERMYSEADGTDKYKHTLGDAYRYAYDAWANGYVSPLTSDTSDDAYDEGIASINAELAHISDIRTMLSETGQEMPEEYMAALDRKQAALEEDRKKLYRYPKGRQNDKFNQLEDIYSNEATANAWQLYSEDRNLARELMTDRAGDYGSAEYMRDLNTLLTRQGYDINDIFDRVYETQRFGNVEITRTTRDDIFDILQTLSKGKGENQIAAEEVLNASGITDAQGNASDFNALHDWQNYLTKSLTEKAEQNRKQKEYEEKIQGMYSEASGSADWEALSQAPDRESEGYEDLPGWYKAINGDRQYVHVMDTGMFGMGGSKDIFEGYGYRYITDEQKALVNYYYNKYGPEKARDFLDNEIGPSLRALERSANAKEIAQLTTQYPALMSIYSHALNLQAAMYAPTAIVAGFLDDGSASNEVLMYNMTQPGADKDLIRAGVSEQVYQSLGEVGKFFYGVGTSVIDNVTAVAASGAFAGLSKGAQALTLFIMSSSAASSSMREQLDNGTAPRIAAIIGLADGLIEYGTEKISLDALFSDPKTIRGYLLKNVFAEGSEEVESNLGTRLMLAFMLGNEDKNVKRYKDLRAMGYGEGDAWHIIVGEWMGEDLTAFLSGAVSGGVMAGPRAVRQGGAKIIANYFNRHFGDSNSSTPTQYEGPATDTTAEVAEAETADSNTVESETDESNGNGHLTNKLLGVLDNGEPSIGNASAAGTEGAPAQSAQEAVDAQERAHEEAARAERERETRDIEWLDTNLDGLEANIEYEAASEEELLEQAQDIANEMPDEYRPDLSGMTAQNAAAALRTALESWGNKSDTINWMYDQVDGYQEVIDSGVAEEEVMAELNELNEQLPARARKDLSGLDPKGALKAIHDGIYLWESGEVDTQESSEEEMRYPDYNSEAGILSRNDGVGVAGVLLANTGLESDTVDAAVSALSKTDGAQASTTVAKAMKTNDPRSTMRALTLGIISNDANAHGAAVAFSQNSVGVTDEQLQDLADTMIYATQNLSEDDAGVRSNIDSYNHARDVVNYYAENGTPEVDAARQDYDRAVESARQAQDRAETAKAKLEAAQENLQAAVDAVAENASKQNLDDMTNRTSEVAARQNEAASLQAQADQSQANVERASVKLGNAMRSTHKNANAYANQAGTERASIRANGEMSATAKDTKDNGKKPKPKAPKKDGAQPQAPAGNRTQTILGEDTDKLKGTGKPHRKIKSLERIAQELTNASSLTRDTNKGRFRRDAPEKTGKTTPPTGVAKVRGPMDVVSTAHEAMHDIDYDNKLGSSKLMQDLIAQSPALQNYLAANYEDQSGWGSEALAQYAEAWITNPQYARETYGNEIADAFEGLLRDRGILNAWLRASKDYRSWLMLDDARRIAYGMIDSSGMNKNTAGKSVRQILDRAVETFLQREFDQHLPIDRMIYDLKNMGVDEGTADRSVRILARSMNVVTNNIVKHCTTGKYILDHTGEIITDKDGQVKSVKEVMQAIPQELRKDFSTFLLLELNQDRIKSGHPIIPIEDLGVDEDTARAKLLKEHPEFEDVAKELYRTERAFSQEYEVNMGLISQERYDNLWKVYPHYVPAYAEFIDTTWDGGTSSRKPGSGIMWLQDGPSNRTRKDPIDALTQQIERRVKNAKQVEVNRALAELYDRAMIKGSMPGIMDEIKDGETTGLTVGERNAADVISVPWSLDEKGDIVYRRFQIYDRNVYNALLASPVNLPSFLRAIGRLKNIVSTALTVKDPMFALSNTPSDTVTAVATGYAANNIPQYLVEMGKTFKEMAKNEFRDKRGKDVDDAYRYWDVFGNTGGKISNEIGTRGIKQLRSEIYGKRTRGATDVTGDFTSGLSKFIEKTVDIAEITGELSEAWNRYTQFKYAKDMYVDKSSRYAENLTRGLASRRGTTDFSQHGIGIESKALQSVVPFFNAGMQGFYKSFSWMTNPLERSERAKDMAKRGAINLGTSFVDHLASRIMGGTIFHLLLRALVGWDKDKEEKDACLAAYDIMTAYEGVHYINIYRKDGKFIRMRNTQDSGALAIQKLGAMFADMITGSETDPLGRYGGYLGQIVSDIKEVIIPDQTIFSPITDSELLSGGEGTTHFDVPLGYAYPTPHKLAQWIGNFFGTKPEAIQYCAEQYSGLWGKLGLTAADRFLRWVSGEDAGQNADAFYNEITDLVSTRFSYDSVMSNKLNRECQAGIADIQQIANMRHGDPLSGRLRRGLDESEIEEAKEDAKNLYNDIKEINRHISSLVEEKKKYLDTEDDEYNANIARDKQKEINAERLRINGIISDYFAKWGYEDDKIRGFLLGNRLVSKYRGYDDKDLKD